MTGGGFVRRSASGRRDSVCARRAVSHATGTIVRRSVADSRGIGGGRLRGFANHAGQLSPFRNIYASVAGILLFLIHVGYV